jgi:hypothetical protein
MRLNADYVDYVKRRAEAPLVECGNIYRAIIRDGRVEEQEP